jgi:hypothetical protein
MRANASKKAADHSGETANSSASIEGGYPAIRGRVE